MKKKLLFFALYCVASLSINAQQIQFLTPEVATCTFSERTGPFETKAERTINSRLWQRCPLGNVIVNVRSHTPLALLVVYENYEGTKTRTIAKPSCHHKIDLLVIENVRITVTPFSENQ